MTGADETSLDYREGYRAGYQRAEGIERVAALTTSDQLRNDLATTAAISERLALQVMTLTQERDRARDVAVALEQELAGYDARVEAALKQVMCTADMVDAREKAGFILAGWQDPDPVDIPPFSEQVLGIGRQELAERERYRLAALGEFQRPDTAPPAAGWTVAPGLRSTVDPGTGVTWVTMPDGSPINPSDFTHDAATVIASGVPVVIPTADGDLEVFVAGERVEFDAREYANTPVPAYDSSGEPHPFAGTEEACARCGLVRAAPYHHGPDARRPGVLPGQWVRILKRPAGLPAGQIGKVMPPGFTPPSTAASRVIAVDAPGFGHIDASAWQVIDDPDRDFLQEIAEKMTNHDYERDQELDTGD